MTITSALAERTPDDLAETFRAAKRRHGDGDLALLFTALHCELRDRIDQLELEVGKLREAKRR
jgi:hypothetical protein